MSKVKCEVCGNEYEMTNPEYGCPFCHDKNNNDAIFTFNNNLIATILKIIAWIAIILGFAGGIIIGSEETTVLMYITWVVCGMFSVFCFAIAEIIQILHDIRKKLENKK